MAIADTTNIKQAQGAFQDRLNAVLKEREGAFTIGYQGGNKEFNSLRANDKIWFAHMVNKERATPCHWNAFGLADQLNINASNPIAVEINIPLSGVPRNVGGLFAVDTKSDKIWLLHRGKVGGGKKGIGKGTFLNWYTKKPVKVQYSKTMRDSDDVIPVADLSSPKFGKQITEFVCSVGQFKAKVRQDEISSLSIDELRGKIEKTRKKPKKTTIETTAFERNPYVVEYAKRRAMGTCQLCESPAPFKDNGGQPYLECHHIIWLSDGGEDAINNAVALCPNCHRKMHIINGLEDVARLGEKAKKKIKSKNANTGIRP
jgi:5-methylcytosine-specific restriction protein A